MSQNAITFVQFFGIALAISVIAHSLSRRLEVASGVAAVASAALAITYWSFRQGYFDGWFIIAFVTLSAIGAAVAFAVGFAFRHFRRQREPQRHAA
jgi:hypothetical protein